MNAEFLCSDCGKVHTNSVIEGFNRFMELADPGHTYSEFEVRGMFRFYLAGQHDALMVLFLCADAGRDLGEHQINAFALHLRSALLQACPDIPEAEKEHMKYCLTEKFFIRDGPCRHGN